MSKSLARTAAGLALGVALTTGAVVAQKPRLGKPAAPKATPQPLDLAVGDMAGQGGLSSRPPRSPRRRSPPPIGRVRIFPKDPKSKVYTQQVQITPDAEYLNVMLRTRFPLANLTVSPAGDNFLFVDGAVENPADVEAVENLLKKFYSGGVVNAAAGCESGSRGSMTVRAGSVSDGVAWPVAHASGSDRYPSTRFGITSRGGGATAAGTSPSRSSAASSTAVSRSSHVRSA